MKSVLLLASFVSSFAWASSMSYARAADRQSIETSELVETSLRIDGMNRWFLTQHPSSAGQGAPLVILLHGGTSSMHKTLKWLAGKDWRALSEREGFVLIAPNGTQSGGTRPKGNKQHWNDYRDPPAQSGSDVDDVKFILSVIDWAADNHGIDRSRVYVTGASNGGMMTYRMLLDAPHAFAGGAAFIAMLPEATPKIEASGKSVPLMIANATEDPLSPWEGDTIGFPGYEDVVISTPKTRDYWLTRNQTERQPHSQRIMPHQSPEDNCTLQIEDYQSFLRNGAPIRFVTMQGSGHTVPSRTKIPQTKLEKKIVGNRCYDANGADMAWAFLTGAPDPVVNDDAEPKRKSFRDRWRERRAERRAR